MSTTTQVDLPKTNFFLDVLESNFVDVLGSDFEISMDFPQSNLRAVILMMEKDPAPFISHS